jgi:hypothetical protein
MRSAVLALGDEGDAARRSARVSGAAGRLAVNALVYLSICMLFLISEQRLKAWGVNYEDPGGNPLSKVHPGTWAIFAAFGLAALRSGNPVSFLNKLGRWGGLSIFFGVWSMLLVVIVVFEKTPFTPIIDSFLLPMVIFAIAVERIGPKARSVALLIHALLAANAVLGIIEYLTGWRLTPFTAGDYAQTNDWRSTAFLGHPLANASIVGVYIVALALGGGRDLPSWLRPPMMILQMAAMVAFGGRAALVLTVFLLLGIALKRVFDVFRGRRVPLPRAALICFCAPFLIGAVTIAAQAGFFDRLLERFVQDNGSAEARVIMMRVFAMFPLRQIVFGPDQNWLTSLQYEEGINYGIESFWVSFILEHGLIISLIFFAGLAAFCVDLARATRPATILLLVHFFGVASSSISLTAKSCTFGLFVAIVMYMMRPVRPRVELRFNQEYADDSLATFR